MEFFKKYKDTKYFIAMDGNVHSFYQKKPRILKSLKDDQGYVKTTFGQKRIRTHRLVAGAFISNPENKKYVNHKNGIKHDNRVENLEWCTAKENILHSINILGNKPCGKGAPKLTKTMVLEIRALCKNEKNNLKISKMYNVDRRTIYDIRNKLSWKEILCQ